MDEIQPDPGSEGEQPSPPAAPQQRSSRDLAARHVAAKIQTQLVEAGLVKQAGDSLAPEVHERLNARYLEIMKDLDPDDPIDWHRAAARSIDEFAQAERPKESPDWTAASKKDFEAERTRRQNESVRRTVRGTWTSAAPVRRPTPKAGSWNEASDAEVEAELIKVHDRQHRRGY